MSAAAAAAPMVAAAAGAAGAAGAPAAAPAPAGWSLSSLVRMLMLYWFVSSFFKGGKTATEVRDVSTGVVHQPHRAAWPENTPYSMYVFVHDSAELNVNQYTAATLNPRSLLWFESGMRYGWNPLTSERALNWTMNVESWPLQHLQANGSLYAHAFFVKDSTPLFKYRAVGDVGGEEAYTHTHDALVVSDAGAASDSTALSSGHSVPSTLSRIPSSTSEGFQDHFVANPGFEPRNIVHRVMGLNLFRPAPKVVDKKNLLGVGADANKVNVSTELEIKTTPAAAQEEEEEVEGLEGLTEDDEDEFLGFDDEDESSPGVASKRSSAASGVKKGGKKAVVSEVPWLNFWKPFLSIRLIPDWTVFPYGGIPAEMVGDYVVDPLTDTYAPLVYFDYFWLLKDQLLIVNHTVSELSLNLTTSPLSLMKWRMECQMETSWKMQQSWGMQEEDGRDSEMFKRMVLDTNIYLLAITFFVSILHMIFDFLAFKNDVKFWKEAKTMRGLSTRTILINILTQTIIFFYLLDNDTSYMVLFSSGVGIIIEIWKAQKAMVIKFDRTRPFPHIRILNKNMSEDKAEEEKTDEEKEMELHAKYDGEAMVYLSYALYPLVVCYAGYSLYYESHKSWYSFILAVLCGCVYTFGFIMMCPQLYMNYKLRSVAHLPWRMLTYKALNTFIDDLFAFVITMPTLHRLACFRDDLIFFIFLYQKWAYRVDFKRVNEFGAAFLSEEEQKKIEDDDRAAREAAAAKEAEAKRGAYVEEIKEEKKKSAAAATTAAAGAADSALVEESESSAAAADTLRQRTNASAMMD